MHFTVLKTVIVALISSCLLFYPVKPGRANQPVWLPISAESALLMDVDNGQILYGKNYRVKRPMASTTKIMTAVVALSGADLQGLARVSPHAASVGESSMYLKAGEMLTLEQLLYGALLPSGNDACVAIAEHVAGSEGTFVNMMNQKAALIGAAKTSFKNTNGLPAPGHFTTALDLAIIARNALHSPSFCEIVKTRSKIVEGPGGLHHYLQNTNQLLWRYPGADGVKTGTTIEAGKCLVASATVGDRRLLAVILNGNNRFEDAALLFDYGLKEYKNFTAVYSGEILEQVNVQEGFKKTVPVKAAGDIKINVLQNGTQKPQRQVNITRSITAPVYEGEQLGKITFQIDGRTIGSTDLVAAGTVRRLTAVEKAKNKLRAFCYQTTRILG